MKKLKKTYFQRVDYIFKHNALTKFIVKKAWYNFYSGGSYKWLYILAFSFLAFLIMYQLGLRFKLTEDYIFLWFPFFSLVLSGVGPALMLLYSSIKALKANK